MLAYPWVHNYHQFLNMNLFILTKYESIHFACIDISRKVYYNNYIIEEMESMQKPTLADVAALAGVSTGTVSKYINGLPVRPKNQQKIQSAIDRLHYTPSTLARSFASGRSYTVLLMIIAESPIVTSTWLHELPIILGLTEAVNAKGYSIKIEINALDETEQNLRKIDSYSRGKSDDAIVILSPWEPDARLIHPLEYYGIPYVIIGSDSSGRNTGYIDFDNQQPMQDLVQLMYDAGGREFALIGGFEKQRHMIYRTKGYLKKLEELRLPNKAGRVAYGDYSLKSGYEAAMKLLTSDDPPDCILCGNDYIASGAVRAAHELNISIPEALMISGFDNSVVSEATFPSITSVSAPVREMGYTAGRELMKRLEDPEYVIQNQLLKCAIVPRDSTVSHR